MQKASRTTLFVVCALSLATAAGCFSQSAGETKNQVGKQKPAEPTAYMFFRNIGAVGYPEDGGLARKLIAEAAARAGIKDFDYKVTLYSGKEYFTKLNLMAASGTLPDYFDVDVPTLTKFVAQGLVMPLDELLKKSSHIMRYIRKDDFETATYDGKIYGLPAGFRPEPFNQPNVGGILIRRDWLQNVGLTPPTTLEEFHKVLQAFTFNDPDGNGKRDTYGLGANKEDLSQNKDGGTFDAIFGAYGVNPFFWFERDGMIKKGFVLPETKQALATLQQWYKEGLIDPDFPLEEKKQMMSYIASGKIGMYGGLAYDVSDVGPLWTALKDANPKAELAFIAPPRGPQGQYGWPDVMPGSKLAAVNVKAKDPEKLFRFLDWSVTDEFEGGGFLLREGIEGKHYTYDREKNKIETRPRSEQVKDGFSQPIKFVGVSDRRWTNEVVREAIALAAAYPIKNALWKTMPAQLEYPDLEGRLWQEYFVKIVTGEWPVGKWDEFVRKYYDQGGREVEKQANAAWEK